MEKEARSTSTTKVVYFDGRGAVVEPTSPKVTGFRPANNLEEDVFPSPSFVKKVQPPSKTLRRK